MAFLTARPRRGAAALALLAAVALSLPLAGPAPAFADQALEAAVKASYLLKFAPFVDWPAAAFAAPDAPFTLCIAGEDPFGQAVDDAIRGQKLLGRRVVLRRLAGPAGVGGCHILFLGRTRGAQGADFLRAAAGKPVLTVADQDRGVAGAMIEFVLKDGRVRFAIDADKAEENGLTISSKLLSLALSVKRTAR